MNNFFDDLQPGPHDLVVIPADMDLPDGEHLGCDVYRMKFLHNPSIVRAGGFNMNFLQNFKLADFFGSLGFKPDNKSIKEVIFDHGEGKLRDSQMPHTGVIVHEDTDELPEVSSLVPVVANVTFPNDVVKTDLPRFWRYKRPEQIVKRLDGFSKAVSPKGGVTFYIELDAANKTFAFSYALCHNKDNFSYELGRQISKGRFDGDDWYEVKNYDESIGVVENIAIALGNLLYNSSSSLDGNKDILICSLSDKFTERDIKELFERI